MLQMAFLAHLDLEWELKLSKFWRLKIGGSLWIAGRASEKLPVFWPQQGWPDLWACSIGVLQTTTRLKNSKNWLMLWPWCWVWSGCHNVVKASGVPKPTWSWMKPPNCWDCWGLGQTRSCHQFHPNLLTSGCKGRCCCSRPVCARRAALVQSGKVNYGLSGLVEGLRLGLKDFRFWDLEDLEILEFWGWVNRGHQFVARPEVIDSLWLTSW